MRWSNVWRAVEAAATSGRDHQGGSTSVATTRAGERWRGRARLPPVSMPERRHPTRPRAGVAPGPSVAMGHIAVCLATAFPLHISCCHLACGSRPLLSVAIAAPHSSTVNARDEMRMKLQRPPRRCEGSGKKSLHSLTQAVYDAEFMAQSATVQWLLNGRCTIPRTPPRFMHPSPRGAMLPMRSLARTRPIQDDGAVIHGQNPGKVTRGRVDGHCRDHAWCAVGRMAPQAPARARPHARIATRSLVRHSSNAVDIGMAQDARWTLGSLPNPGLRAGV